MTQEEALDILKLGHNVFLTGSAGSGKTFLLNRYVDYLRESDAQVGLTASTGIAATHIGGMTVHSWSGIGIKDELTDREMERIMAKAHLRRRIEGAKVLVIDEVSMLHPFQLDMVSQVCQAFRQDVRPFGGLQVVLCGDFFQLPPVAKGREEVRFATESEVWQNMDLKVCYLTEQYRHGLDELTEVLNDIRGNKTGEHTLKILRRAYKAQVVSPTKLYTHNADVDFINEGELRKLPGEPKFYEMEFEGSQKLAEALKKGCLAPERLAVKEGAVVMFVKNDFDAGYVNGTLGRVVGFENGLPVVRTTGGGEIVAGPKGWMIEEGGKIRAEIFQIPLRLAWAITVHKSQGMTLDAAEVDLSKAFAFGMGYVALSRVRDLAGLRLMGLNEMALKVNESALALDESLQEASEAVAAELDKMPSAEKEGKQEEFLQSVSFSRIKKGKPTIEETASLAEQKVPVEEMAGARGLTAGTILGHLEKLTDMGQCPDLGYLAGEFSARQLKDIKEAFQASGGDRLAPVRGLLGKRYSYEKLRLARLILKNK